MNSANLSWKFRNNNVNKEKRGIHCHFVKGDIRTRVRDRDASTRKTQVTERIFQLTLIHASVISLNSPDSLIFIFHLGKTQMTSVRERFSTEKQQNIYVTTIEIVFRCGPCCSRLLFHVTF